MSSKKQYTKSGVQRSPVLTVFRKPWFLHAFSIILILSNSWLSVWMRKRAGSFPPPHILAINHAEVHCILSYLQSWFWDQCLQFTAVTFNFNSRSAFTLHCNILSWNLSKWTHMTLTYLTLQKGIRILKMTHQRNGWSPVTGNKRTAPIVKEIAWRDRKNAPVSVLWEAGKEVQNFSEPFNYF